MVADFFVHFHGLILEKYPKLSFIDKLLYYR